ncbi:hypothetical protein LGH82_22005 [Mesorhizobium sp. PAMC28654]|uniref:hypothetical protein n=1 Tax=Mesorhizobium sp. PAMC28654 TaxID=2880934 RepID=UPI001D0A55F2|nr:hypothetical protein [Mesorhizobium sp. PAMC28654]UDL87827.1 hypothetical protein LGH82_22005 [Mesorhizobium sp. PAMC28654]
MRSFTSRTSLKTATVAAFLVAIPFAGAYAAGHHRGALDEGTPIVFEGPRVDGIVGQLQGISSGIKDAEQQNLITPAVAHSLQMRDADISRVAEKTAASNNGRIPSAQYHQLLRRVDHLDQKLMIDTGSGFNIGDVSDGGHYPNG